MDWKSFKKNMKKKIRKTTGQEEPYERSREGDEVKSKSQGLFKGYSDDDMDEINEARKKWLKSRSRK